MQQPPNYKHQSPAKSVEKLEGNGQPSLQGHAPKIQSEKLHELDSEAKAWTAACSRLSEESAGGGDQQEYSEADQSIP